MALINCKECGKEISDKAASCPNCGCPLQEHQSIQDEQGNRVMSNINNYPKETFAEAKKNPMKIIVPVIVGLLVTMVVISVYVFMSVVPNGKYNDAITLLERGKYDEANVLFNQLGDFKDVETIQNQIKYESVAYNCINELKKYLKNPDSYLPYEINFYLGKEAKEDKSPGCVMHYGAQNGFGGNTTSYAVFTYSEEKEQYSLLGTCDTLDEEDLDKDDDDYIIEALAVMLINGYKDNGIEVGDIDMARLKTVLKNDAYSSIKIIN